MWWASLYHHSDKILNLQDIDDQAAQTKEWKSTKNPGMPDGLKELSHGLLGILKCLG